MHVESKGAAIHGRATRERGIRPGLVALFLLGLASQAGVAGAASHPSGLLPVGYQTLEIVDLGRADGEGESETAPRRIELHLGVAPSHYLEAEADTSPSGADVAPVDVGSTS